MIARAKSGIFKPKVYTATTISEEPEIVDQAIKKWKEFMDDEYNAIIKNKTWSFVLPPKHKTIVGCRWIYKLKKSQMRQFLDTKQD